MKEALQIMNDRFGKDSLIALATVEDGVPHVRTVNAYYEGGAFYIITHAASGKMRQISKNSVVAVAGDWFTGHGTGENLGHVLLLKNAALMEKLRAAFSAWYTNGHVNEADSGTCILRVRLTDGVLFADGKRFDLQF